MSGATQLARMNEARADEEYAAVGVKDPTDKSSGSRPNGQLVVRAVMKSASAPHGARARVRPRSAPPRAHRTPSSATRGRQLREAIRLIANEGVVGV